MIEPKDIDWTCKVHSYIAAFRLCPACGAAIGRTYLVVHTVYGSVRAATGCGCVRVANTTTVIGTASPALLLALELMR